MLFAHIVKLPESSSLLPPNLRLSVLGSRASLVGILPPPLQVDVAPVDVVGDATNGDDPVPYLGAGSATPPVSGASSPAIDTTIEFAFASESYTQSRRLTDLCKLEDLLEPPRERVQRARTLSASPRIALQETTDAISEMISRRRSDVSAAAWEKDILHVMESFLDTLKRTYDERQMVSGQRMDADLDAMLVAIDDARLKMREMNDSSSPLADELTEMIRRVQEDVVMVEYVKL
ncbi:Aste57867_22494 [Aphanomyces stellatus]|uniref:Aste57867_22494 protein n=1 Tax=Aphanomyces stellatus TaxID=120398 RepID=A0A485LKH8_9STRA|nr:hypothetical protein As57867_022424 [Aphanomyces stellatus]VFT99154.1 Aste57867_22494 [Aphanomyces stellatus]